MLFRRAEPYFVAFDLLWCDGKDLRSLCLLERKFKLRRVIRENAQRILYANHVEEHGEDLFHLACEHDLECIVAKLRFGPYLSDSDETSWMKIRNNGYSQMKGRNELFDWMAGREREQNETDGWAGCVLACAEAEL